VQELRVVGVRVELPGNQPILLLKETQGERYLPIWIGAVEAAAIAFEQQGVRPARPMTHDLLREVVRTLGATLEAVNITEMRDGIYIAELVFGENRVVSARPSDAVALAVRTGAPTRWGSRSPTSRRTRSRSSASSSTRSHPRTSAQGPVPADSDRSLTVGVRIPSAGPVSYSTRNGECSDTPLRSVDRHPGPA
jgi:uncharacterized protein